MAWVVGVLSTALLCAGAPVVPAPADERTDSASRLVVPMIRRASGAAVVPGDCGTAFAYLSRVKGLKVRGSTDSIT
jgi:hypothetical protein